MELDLCYRFLALALGTSFAVKESDFIFSFNTILFKSNKITVNEKRIMDILLI